MNHRSGTRWCQSLHSWLRKNTNESLTFANQTILPPLPCILSSRCARLLAPWRRTNRFRCPRLAPLPPLSSTFSLKCYDPKHDGGKGKRKYDVTLREKFDSIVCRSRNTQNHPHFVELNMLRWLNKRNTNCCDLSLEFLRGFFLRTSEHDRDYN